MSAIVAQPPAAEAEGTKSVTPNDFVHSIVGKSVIILNFAPNTNHLRTADWHRL